jgi:hypothetical protein
VINIETPTREQIIDFFGSDVVNVEEVEIFLEQIECPIDFRGLGFVFGILDYVRGISGQRWLKLLEIEQNTFDSLQQKIIQAPTANQQILYNKTKAKGWLSLRPIYSLLFIFYDYQDDKMASALLSFLSHYFTHEVEIKSNRRVEEATRAFRLSYTDPDVANHLRTSGSPDALAMSAAHARESIKALNPSNQNPSSLTYLYSLEHFYRLNWTTRVRQSRDSPSKTRSYFQRTKLARLPGSGNLLTASLKAKYLSNDKTEDPSACLSEDYPSVTIVQINEEGESKERHERPDIAVIKDEYKIEKRRRQITRDVRRSHNLLPTDRAILQPHELHLLWHELISSSSSTYSGVPANYIQSLICLIWFLGKELDELLNIPVHHNQSHNEPGLHVTDASTSLIVAPSPTTKSSLSHKRDLLRVGSTVTLSLPTFICEKIIAADIHMHETIGCTYRLNTIKSAVDGFLKVINHRNHCQIGVTRIECFLQNFLVAQELHDPVILELLSGKISYYTRAPRHYAWYSEREINARTNSIWQDVLNQMMFFDPNFKPPELMPSVNTNSNVDNESGIEQHIGVGSCFTPTKIALQTWISSTAAHLKTHFESRQITRQIESLIEYHNTYTTYTLGMLLSGTGYRAVCNPLPSLSLIFPERHTLCISDKDSTKTFSHMRVIVCPRLLRQQLQFYQGHINTMANLLSVVEPLLSKHLFSQLSPTNYVHLQSKSERIEHFITIRNSATQLGVFFLFSTHGNEAEGEQNKLDNTEQPVIPTTVTPKKLRAEIHLPINFGRHYMRRYLQTQSVHQELIKFQLGHFVSGENPLEKFSSSSYATTVSSLQPIIDEMLIELGWKALPSLLTRLRS